MKGNNSKNKFIKLIAVILVILTIVVFGLVNKMRSDLNEVLNKASSAANVTTAAETAVSLTEITTGIQTGYSYSYEEIPVDVGTAYVTVNNNQPQFDDFDTTTVFETYSKLDSLGRCGVAYANICEELMPTEDRESISDVKPSGWIYNNKSNNNKYDTSLVDGGYIYNRCHLIGFQLAGENDNPQNLITGTRSLNIDGMLPFENMVADHIKEDGGHVLYRVTPRFVDNELVCRGVQIEAYSVEDDGEAICFNVFCFNKQEGISIDYSTGENYKKEASLDRSGTFSTTVEASTALEAQKYIVNDNSKKFHRISCSSVKKMSSNNRVVLVGSKDELVNKGYAACKVCNP